MMPTAPNNRILYKSAEGYHRTMALYDRMLGQITAPYQTRYVTTGVGITHVIQAGPADAPPVFLLHGMSANAVTWVAQINALAERYRVYAPDMPGCMGRSAPTRIVRTDDSYGRWLAEVMDGLEVSAAACVAISFGGWLTLKLAAVAPGRITCALMMSAAGLAPQSRWLMPRLLPRLALMPFVSLEQRARLFLGAMSAPDHTPTPEELELFGLLLSAFTPDQRAPSPCTDAELACLTVPTALLYGAYDAAFDAAAAMRRARRLLPNLVQCELLPGVGHGMTGEDAPGVNRLLLAFLDAYARPA